MTEIKSWVNKCFGQKWNTFDNWIPFVYYKLSEKNPKMRFILILTIQVFIPEPVKTGGMKLF